MKDQFEMDSLAVEAQLYVEEFMRRFEDEWDIGETDGDIEGNNILDTDDLPGVRGREGPDETGRIQA